MKNKNNIDDVEPKVRDHIIKKNGEVKFTEEDKKVENVTILSVVHSLLDDAQKNNNILREKTKVMEEALNETENKLKFLEEIVLPRRNELIQRALRLQERFNAPVPRSFISRTDLRLENEISELIAQQPVEHFSKNSVQKNLRAAV